LPRHKDQSHRDHERTARQVDHSDVRGQPSRDALRAADPAGQQQERDAESERVGDEEQRSGAKVLVQEKREDRAEIGTDARGEAHAKGDPNEEAPRQPGGVALESKVELAVYLDDGAKPSDIVALKARIENDPAVSTVTFVSKDEALRRLSEIAARGNDVSVVDTSGNPLQNELGTTTIVATHNAEIVNALRRRVVHLDHGAIVRDEREGLYAA